MSEFLNFNNVSDSDKVFLKDIVKYFADKSIESYSAVLDEQSKPLDALYEIPVETNYAKNRILSRDVSIYKLGTIITEDIISTLISESINVVYVKNFLLRSGEIEYHRKLDAIYEKNLLYVSQLTNSLDCLISNIVHSVGSEVFSSTTLPDIMNIAVAFPNIFFPKSYYKPIPIKLKKYNGYPMVIPVPTSSGQTNSTNNGLNGLHGSILQILNLNNGGSVTPTQPVVYEEGVVTPPASGLIETLPFELLIFSLADAAAANSGSGSNNSGGANNGNGGNSSVVIDYAPIYMSILTMENSCISNCLSAINSIQIFIEQNSKINLSALNSKLVILKEVLDKIIKRNEKDLLKCRQWFPVVGGGLNSLPNVVDSQGKTERISFISETLANPVLSVNFRDSLPQVNDIYDTRWYWIVRRIHKFYGTFQQLSRANTSYDFFTEEIKSLGMLVEFIKIL